MRSWITSDLDVESILKMDVAALREELIKGTFNSVSLVNVYGERCQSIGRTLNLSAEENFDYAIKLARKRDDERQKAVEDGKEEELPLMHGVPICVQDTIK